MTTTPTDRPDGGDGSVGDRAGDDTTVSRGVPVQLDLGLGVEAEPTIFRTWVEDIGWPAIDRLAAEPRPWTADDVWRLIGQDVPGHPNWVGLVVAQASAEGVIVPVGHGRSARRARHCGHVWWWLGREHAAVAA